MQKFKVGDLVEWKYTENSIEKTSACHGISGIDDLNYIFGNREPLPITYIDRVAVTCTISTKFKVGDLVKWKYTNKDGEKQWSFCQKILNIDMINSKYVLKHNNIDIKWLEENAIYCKLESTTVAWYNDIGKLFLVITIIIFICIYMFKK